MRKSLRISLIGIPVVLILFGWNRFLESVRKAVLGADLTPQRLHTWWLVIGISYLAIFALTAGFILLFFRVLRRQVTGFLKIACITNIFVIWLLLGLSVILSDPLTVTAVSPLGLAPLSNFLWLLGIIWCVLTFYILFRSIDASPTGGADGKP